MVDILWAIFWNAFIQCKFSCFDPKYVPSDQIYSQWALVKMMAERRTSDKLISEPMRPPLLTYICITKPQQVNQKRLAENVMVSFVTEGLNTIGYGE